MRIARDRQACVVAGLAGTLAPLLGRLSSARNEHQQARRRPPRPRASALDFGTQVF
jgi:hypothetical protein